MGLANQFNDIIQREMNVHAAWMPISQPYELGDYGLMADGVFARLGNIKEFGVTFTPQPGKTISIDYKTEVSRITKFAAGAVVNAIPASAIDAKVTLSFGKERSFIITSPRVTVNTIPNVQQVANALKNAGGWRRVWKVVYETYHAEEAVVMSTVDRDTDISFSGSAPALESLSLGKADVSFGVEGDKKIGLSFQGKEGIIALGLFKLKLFGPGPAFLSDEEKQKDAEVEVLDKIKLEDDI